MELSILFLLRSRTELQELPKSWPGGGPNFGAQNPKKRGNFPSHGGHFPSSPLERAGLMDVDVKRNNADAFIDQAFNHKEEVQAV